ncbi:hypothetical protein FH972_003705 [Carpinus fangiana]|uniref:Uncharacterized protein n=1 Tax=Carpinus fangiana TaxID=176857 RepID=A0A5N6QLK5_9ROSI|nr:hypothetical protein FH972_003705 [Carpinus fangiana]
MSSKAATGLSSHSRLHRGRLLSFLSLTVCWGESEEESEIEKGRENFGDRIVKLHIKAVQRQ